MTKTNNIDYKKAFEAMPGSCLLIVNDPPYYTIAAASKGYVHILKMPFTRIVGNSFFEVFPPNANDPDDNGAENLLRSFEKVTREKTAHSLPIFRYDTAGQDGSFSERYWNTVNSPILNEAGEVVHLLHCTNDVTDKQQADEQRGKLRNMEQLQNLFLQAPIAIHIFRGPDAVIDMANDFSLKLWGRDRSIIGKKLAEVFPELSDDYPKIFRQIMATGEPQRGYEVPVQLNRNNRSEAFYVNYVFQPYYETGQKAPVGVLAFVNDITERVSDARALRESETRFRRIANTLQLVVWTASPDGQLTYISDQWFNYYGNPVAESLGTGWTDFVYEEDRASAGSKWVHSLQTGDDYETEFRVHHKSGKFHWVLVRAVAIRNAAGEIEGWYGSNTDIESNKQAEAKILRSEQIYRRGESNLRNTILKAPVAMCIFRGPKFIVEIANERMIALWGATGREVTGYPIFQVIPEVTGQGFEELLDGVFRTGEAYSAQGVPLTVPRGNILEQAYVNFLYEAFREPNGEISGIIAIAIDVTEQILARKKIEEVVTERTRELAEANAHLQRSNAELAQFAYIASHDLQEPLRKISVFSQMLGQHLSNAIDAQTRNYLGKIETSVARMINLVRDVLVYSELSREATAFRPVDLQSIFKGILTDFELLIEQKNAVITISALPVINGVDLQMSQLFSNLISNALKFSRHDAHPHIKVSSVKLTAAEAKLHSVPADSMWHSIQVRDNGIGFSREYSEQIFNIFQRLHGKSAYSGTGIGLAMCRKIVQNHGGYISATSEEGMGAIFTILLPADRHADEFKPD